MVTDIHDGGRQPGDEETTGAEVIPFRRTRATSRQDEPDAPETAHAAFGAQLAALSAVPGQAPRTGSSGVTAAIVTEIRARREGLAADERRARDFPPRLADPDAAAAADGGRVHQRAAARPDPRAGEALRPRRGRAADQQGGRAMTRLLIREPPWRPPWRWGSSSSAGEDKNAARDFTMMTSRRGACGARSSSCCRCS